MRSFANDEYIPPLAEEQHGQAVVVAGRRCEVEVSICIPWEHAGFFRDVFGTVADQVGEAIGWHCADTERRAEQRQRTDQICLERRRLVYRLGRMAASHVRRARRAGQSVAVALEEFSYVANVPVPHIKQLIRLHKRRIKPRYERFIDRRVAALALAGSSNREIAKYFGWSVSKVAKRVPLALARCREAANDR